MVLRLPDRLGIDALLLPTRIPLRLRVFFRGAFLLLALATLALAASVLQEEKQLGYRNYREGFAKTQAQIVARLRHPTGQLALLNPTTPGGASAPQRPLVLPFSAIDFDDKAKAQQAVEMAGCLVQYGDDASLCVAVGSNPLAGGFIYAVGSFASGELVARRLGERDLSTAHRLRIGVEMRGQAWHWTAPFEAGGAPGQGRLTGFSDEAVGRAAERPVRDFRGWLWQDGRCLVSPPLLEPDPPAPELVGPAASALTDEAPPPPAPAAPECRRRSFFSVRLPVELFRAELDADRSKLVWPPPDLDRIRVHLQVMPPGTDASPLFDSAQPGATPPFALADLTPLLLPGETLRLRRAGAPEGAELVVLTGSENKDEPSSPLIERLIRRLPVDGYDQPLQATDTIATPLGRYELSLTGDVRGVNRALGRVATRAGWFVGAMLAAILLTWAAIELRMIRRITLLTKRAAAVSARMRSGATSDGTLGLDADDLRGSDELGVLAGTLAELMQRVDDDVRREHIRVAQEKDQWHAVGHEIMSPLQSLMVLHADPGDPSHRYIHRMQQAVRVLYGQASPAEAFAATSLPVQGLDLDQFLRHVADNAPHAGIANVQYTGVGAPLAVQADEYALEDVVTHVLRNADRYRPEGSPITVTLQRIDGHAEVGIHNIGPAIEPALLERIFEYGVSDAEAPGAEGSESGSHHGQRGQGLFVARTYLAKMGGTIAARNEDAGVRFVLRLPAA